MTKINLKINKMKRSLSLGAIALCLAFGTVANAQITSTTDTNLSKDGGDGVSVKLVDNKGTIKYLQSTNGITTITSTTSGSKTTTTWQLGGTLKEDTYIDVDGNAFALDGLKLETGDASTNATSESDHGGTGSGWTIIVRDEATGEFRKILASSIVTSGTADDVATAGEETEDEIIITATGIPTAAAARGKVWVYRNGVKLSDLTDYAITTNTVTVTGTSDFSIYTGDVFEVQWIN